MSDGYESARPGAAPRSGHGGATSFVVGFAPWIVYWILTGNVSYAVAIVAALTIAVLANVITLVRHRPLKVLEVGDAIAFAVLGLIGLLAGDAFVERWIQPLGNAALLAVMLGSVVIGRPFTVQYAEEMTEPELWDTPGFLTVTTAMTWVWIVAVGIMTALSLVPPVVQGDATMSDGGSALSVLCYWVVPYSVMGMAVLLTFKLPDWFGAEFDDVAPVVATAAPPIPVDGAADRATIGAAGLHVDPDPVVVDAAARIEVTGARPGEHVTIRATTVDLAGNVWRSTATFVADPRGVVDVASAAPISGDYTTVDANGPIWSMRFATEGATPDIYLPPPQPAGVALEAVVGGSTLTRTLVRRPTSPGARTEEVRSADVVGRLTLPAGEGPWPAVVLLGGSEGGVDSQTSNAGVLAAHGFAAFALGYFGMPGLPDQLARIPLERIAAGIRWLAARDDVRGPVGIMAISRGSEAALSTVSRIDHLPVASLVLVSPSSVTWTAMGDEGTEIGVPSWTLGGDGVPHLDMSDRTLMRDALEDALRRRGRNDRLHPHAVHLAHAYGAALDDPAAADAAIPAERVDAPLLLISGADDQVWPSRAMADAIAARRSAAGRTGDDHVSYPGAGHLLRLGCFPTDVDRTTGIALGGTREGTAAAQADLTPRAVAHLADTLR